jgi:hypothetical protein
MGFISDSSVVVERSIYYPAILLIQLFRPVFTRSNLPGGASLFLASDLFPAHSSTDRLLKGEIGNLSTI